MPFQTVEMPVCSVIESQGEQKLVNVETKVDAAVDFASSPPREESDTITTIDSSNTTVSEDLFILLLGVGYALFNFHAICTHLQTTAELYMVNQMTALREGREMKRSTKERTEELLDLLQLLSKLTGVSDVTDEGKSTLASDCSVSPRDFISFSLSRKLTRQLQDVLAVAAGPVLPDWCRNLTQRVTALFPYSIRHHFFRACAFGPIGRLFRNFIDIPRDESVDPSERVMDEHAACKSELEIRFTNEEGTGLGPTLEFFSLLALEFRRKSLGMWLLDNSEQVESTMESNPSSDYNNPSFGLFPAPYPRNTVPLDVLRHFYIMGIAVAKALQDNHLMDLPLSTPFLKLLACYASSRRTRDSAEVGTLEAELDVVVNAEASRERILKAHSVKGDFSLERRLDEASVEILGCTVQDLCLNMEFISQTTVRTADSKVKLLDVYPWESSGISIKEEPLEPISNENFTLYIRRTLEYCLDKGIRAQMDAFKAGLERVFPLDWLSTFTSAEVGRLISGASGVAWTREELLAYTSPILGYTKSSPAFLLLIDVLVAFDTAERRKFLRFISGSSSLPVGGLKNLNPRLRIVCKDPTEGPYPSVNTCAHYLKLPEYSSAEELRHYLMTAMEQTGFYLN
ncbi:unnamed protein product [Hydatigera taeniaeformis]|uniref:E3 ubiquitin-protein ligase n=1 Tax=Hydatigena taeniaeformis TaxID=6205 RepID=A0A3P7FMD4_HYDTA|nr:unnamed protein product [Hydatigera taeniaeformis]